MNARYIYSVEDYGGREKVELAPKRFGANSLTQKLKPTPTL